LLRIEYLYMKQPVGALVGIYHLRFNY